MQRQGEVLLNLYCAEKRLARDTNHANKRIIKRQT
jgi:hypothetical protein